MENRKAPAARPTAGARPAGAGAKKFTPTFSKPGDSGTHKAVQPARPVKRVGVYKANPGVRAGAAAIDCATGFIPALVFFLVGLWPVAFLVWLAYLLVKDGLPIAALEYRSVGKKLLGLHVEDEATGNERIELVTSVKRNLPAWGGLALGLALWIVSPFVALPVAALPAIVELVVILKDPNGVRLGDKLGRTRVLD